MELQVIGLFVVLFVAVAAGTSALLWAVTDPQVTRRRLSQVARGPAPIHVESVLGETPSRLARQARAMLPRSPVAIRRVQALLARAGYQGEWPAIAFVALQLLLPAIPLVGTLLMGGTGTALVLSVIAAVTAYHLPNLWLERRIEARRTEIRNGLPDAIDLLIVCIEAGSAIDQAMLRITEELGLAYPALTRELELVTAEIRAGKPRVEAFRNFAERTKVDDVRALVGMLVQTDRFGTSLGRALRTHADTSRSKRRQRAEERAAKLGVKLLFPLVFCLFPAFYLVVLGPSLLRIFRQLVWGPLGR
jgi:tight adherence protein C